MAKKNTNQIAQHDYKFIIQNGMEILYAQKGYTRKKVVEKLVALNYKATAATMSNIMNGQKIVKDLTLRDFSEGIQKILTYELGLTFDADKMAFLKTKDGDWQPMLVPEHQKGLQGFTFHAEGRVPVTYKTQFIANASEEVLELGVRLHSFASYFESQNDSIYRAHILKLLERGVNVKAYMLNPESNEARLYFEDRTRATPSEGDAIRKIKEVIGQLRSVCAYFEGQQLEGKFEIFLYKHIPYGFFYMVDGNRETGKMMISPYLYGVSRANCPVIEITKKDQHNLYKRYQESIRLFIKDAVPLKDFKG